MTSPRPLPPTLAQYELQVDDALRALCTSSHDVVPVPDFKTVSEAYNQKKPVHVLAQEIMDRRHFEERKNSSTPDSQQSLF